MAAKKPSSSSEKQLKAAVKKLEAELERKDAKAARWKRKAKQAQATAASSKKRIAKLETKLAKARRANTQPDVSPAVELPDVVPVESAPSTDVPTRTPDDSWTVVELREEARSRGLAGLSRKTKAELITALT